MQLGKYQLVRRLAVGGMAELFLARATGSHGFEKLVVLKRILPSFAENPAFTSMFLAEARLAAGLDHPNIAHVFDFGEQHGTFYFTMEYVRGRDLREVVRAAREKNKRLPLSVVVQVIVGMLAGLHHAHEHRDANDRPLEIVHRDISPANALITYEGDVKLVDFGIAKAAALGPATVAGTLKGKIAYMSPEQCRGDILDRRSDLFSIGTLLWELTVGRRLFGTSTNTNELALLRTVDEALVPEPSTVAEGYPSELAKIVVKALARNPHERYQTALEFRVALEAFAVEARLPISSAHTAQFMNELFPVDERDDRVSHAGDHGTQAPEVTGRKISATRTLPGTGQDMTRPERSAPISVNTQVAEVTTLQPRRSYVPLVASLGVLLLFSGGAYALFGGSSDDTRAREGTTPAAASLAPQDDERRPTAPEAAAPPKPEAAAAPTAREVDAPPKPEAAAAPTEPAAAAPTALAPEADVPNPGSESAEPAAAPEKKRRSKPTKRTPKPATAEATAEPQPDPEPAPETKPKGDDPFMAPDPNRRRGRSPFF